MRNLAFLFLLSISIKLMGISIDAPKAPPSIPLLAMENIKIDFYQDVSTEEVPKIIRGKGELYILPVNVGALLYNKGADIKLLGTTSSGLLSLLSSEVECIDDLSEKKLYIGGQGSSPDVVTKKILRGRGIDPKISYRSSSEIAKLAMVGKIKNIVLPEPLATLVLSKNKEFKRVVQLKDLWPGKRIPQVGIFVRGDLYRIKKDEVLKFKEDYIKSLEKVRERVLIEKAIKDFSLNLSVEEFRESLLYSNLDFEEKNRELLEAYLDILQVELPGDDFYVP